MFTFLIIFSVLKSHSLKVLSELPVNPLGEEKKLFTQLI